MNFVRDFKAYPRRSRSSISILRSHRSTERIQRGEEQPATARVWLHGLAGNLHTDIFPYQDAPVTRLPNEPQRWISAIREHLAEPVAMQAAGKALQEWVLANFILEDHATDWLEAYGP